MPLQNIKILQQKYGSSTALRKYGEGRREDDQGNLLSDVLRDFADDAAIPDLKRSLEQRKNIASHGLWQSIKPEIGTKGNDITRLEIVMDSYWQSVEYGQKPGIWPNFYSIQNWMASKGIGKGLPEKKLHGLNYVIRRAIYEKGTIKRFGYKGSGFVSKVFNQQYLNTLSKVLSAITGQTIAVSIVFAAEEAKKDYKL